MGALPSWMQRVRLQSVSDLWRRENLPQGEIDMGNGRVLGAEDVLEGHYRRLASRRQESPAKSSTRQVAVRVGDNLTVAIAVMAPDLLPLTEVAEQVSGAVPLVEPERRFRENLHQALERTHRQHAAQRVLGTRPASRRKQAAPVGWWVVAAGIVATIAIVLGWRWRQNSAPAV